ncbi:hypothetical protein L596_003017 [Steinernema carpocapsae]|uniref:Adenosine deaminase domain-containing protein n=1 Tax=Steinernema carpocapsae TaxID=34508 RepID=A0A4U8USU7_STECR|nr:hypothetical protein L596_003017 [Steinernema carpocapsae]
MGNRINDERLRSFCKKLPKIELHAHLNGSISLKTIKELAKLKSEFETSPGLSDHEQRLLQPQDVLTMDSVFQLFPIIHSLTLHKEAVKLATMNVIEEFAEDGVIYLELRTTPKATAHMTKTEYVHTVLSAIRSAESDNITTRLLLSIDRARGVDDAQETVNILQKFVAESEHLIVGVDLSGNPKADGRVYIPLLQKVRAMGLKVTLHLAELNEYIDELDTFIDFKPDRIGHGTFIYSHAENSIVERVASQKIPFEICLSSNQLCGTTRTIAESHLQDWLRLGNPVCISTDDKGLMATDLSNEYYLASQAFKLTEKALIDFSKTSLRCAFLKFSDIRYMTLVEKISKFEKNFEASISI